MRLDATKKRFDVLTALTPRSLLTSKMTAPRRYRRRTALSIADHLCDPQDVARWDDAGAPGAADSPIFIVGFPRSGTTLLEMVLDAHPQLQVDRRTAIPAKCAR